MPLFTSDKFSRRRSRLIAGDPRHRSANRGYLQVHNSDAHLLVPPTPLVRARSGGASAGSGGAKHWEDDKGEKLRSGSIQRVPELQGIARNLPGHWRGS